MEDIRPTEAVTLTTDDERFVTVESDRSFRLTVDSERFDWPARLISGGTVRKLGQIPDDRELLFDRENECDKVTGRHDLVDLGDAGVETLRSRKPKW